jgi:hypothetical protein
MERRGEASRRFTGRWSPRVRIDFDRCEWGPESIESESRNLVFGTRTTSRAEQFDPSRTDTEAGSATKCLRFDRVDGIPGNLIILINGVPGRYEGSRPIAEVAWKLNPHLSVHLNYIFVFNGRLEERSVQAKTTESYIGPWIAYRF